ncbi:FkbM family methyltransferase [Lysinibacillus piscis]|uniref:Methyltransferase FkbM domain-containing protein n=1 Tax=Lysinibacillus piscis TaxID=2518931 RepID=A0ABQ5NHJ6_9BACI|nr:FkbM family methyltransferase [Lysinibacillus sp. KH24]GLC87819.1 hypothetical protein LYSBPC_09460 [Lysinibacillus sp. KH24]
MKLENLQVLKKLSINKGKLYLWGAGSFGLRTAEYLRSQGIMVEKFIDNDEMKLGKLFYDIEVVDFKQVSSLNQNSYLIVVCSSYFKEIEEQLKYKEIKNYVIIHEDLLYFMDFEKFYIDNEGRFNEMFKNLDQESINVFKGILDFRRTGDESFIKQSVYPQYFHPQVSPIKGDVIIDGGAFQGDTIQQINQALNNECEIHSFEPTTQNFSELKKTVEIQKYGNVFANREGLGEKNEQLKISFNEMYPGGSKISEDGKEIIQITSIDTYFTKNNLSQVDLIKLDVEGFELSSLKGAKNTIYINKPKLQVCLYHSWEDLIDIYEYLREQFDELNYRYYVGHHSDVTWETVLYAVSE